MSQHDFPCAGLAGWLFGHRFVGRYSRQPPRNEVLELFLNRNDPEPLIQAATSIFYKLDICTRCGAVVEKEE